MISWQKDIHFFILPNHMFLTQGKIDGKMLKGKGWLPSLNICSIERGFTYTLVWFHFLFPRFFFKFPDVSVYVLKFPARFFFQMKFPGSPWYMWHKVSIGFELLWNLRKRLTMEIYLQWRDYREQNFKFKREVWSEYTLQKVDHPTAKGGKCHKWHLLHDPCLASYHSQVGWSTKE